MRKLLVSGVWAAGLLMVAAASTPSYSLEADCFVQYPGVAVKACGSDGLGNLTVAGVTFLSSQTYVKSSGVTAYAQNSLIANSVVAGSVAPGQLVVPAATSAIIPRIHIKTNITTGWDQAVIRIKLWSAAPTSYTNGDSGAYAVTVGPTALLLGMYDVTLNQFTDYADGVGVPSAGSASFLSLAGTTVYYDLQYVGTTAVTPIASQTFKVYAEGVE